MECCPDQAAEGRLRQISVKPVAAPLFEAIGWDAQVAELATQMLPSDAATRAVDALARGIGREIRKVVPEAYVAGFAGGAQLRGCAFSVAVPEVDIVVHCDPYVLESRLRAPGGAPLDNRQLQKAALRSFTDKLVASGGFKFRRSAFSADEPKVTLLAGSCEAAAGAGPVPVDLSVNSATPAHHSALTADLGRVDRRAQALVLLVRRWARDRGICHAAKGHLSPYAWTVLTVHFLQVEATRSVGAPAVPCVEALERCSKLLAGAYCPTPQVSEYNVVPARSTPPPSPPQPSAGTPTSIGELFSRFVGFYSEPGSFHKVISIRNPSGLQEIGLDASCQGRPFVEDPFCTARDLGGTASPDGVARLQKELHRAARLLAARATLTEMLEPWVPEEAQAAAPRAL